MDPTSLLVLVSAFLVFLMQAGFLCLEAGLVLGRHAEVVALKNFGDWILANLLFFGVGFGLMFGDSVGGLIGTSLFALEGLSEIAGPIASNETFFLFQLAFAGTAATIVSGALAGRTSFVAYVGATIVMAALVYPIMGHWAWGNLLVSSNAAWLADLGFRDFAGSTVVHSTGAWFALVGAWRIGPRMGCFDALGNPRPLERHSLQLATLGALILWVGWWGFNGGSQLNLDAGVGRIILATNLAGAAGGLSELIHGWARQGGRDLGTKLLGGAIGGLVAITASADVAGPLAALAVGAAAGIVHNEAFDWLALRARIDDPVGAIAVHGACGVWGTLAVAFVLPTDQLATSRLVQLVAQCTGVLACAVWTFGIATLAFLAVEKTVGLRLAPEREREGVDITGRRRPVPEPEEPELDPEILRALMADESR